MQLKCNINYYGINCTVLYCIIMHKKQKQTANVKKKKVYISSCSRDSCNSLSLHSEILGPYKSDTCSGSFSKVSLIFKGENFGKNLVKERHWQYCGPEVRQTYFPELNRTSGSGSTLWIRNSKTEQKFALKIDFAHL